MTGLPSHIRATLDARATRSALRGALGLVVGDRPLVGLVVARGAVAPEDVVQLVAVDPGLRVGAVSHERARELLSLRSAAALARLDASPEAHHEGATHWCIYLDGAAVALVPVTVGARGRAKHGAPGAPPSEAS